MKLIVNYYTVDTGLLDHEPKLYYLEYQNVIAIKLRVPNRMCTRTSCMDIWRYKFFCGDRVLRPTGSNIETIY